MTNRIIIDSMFIYNSNSIFYFKDYLDEKKSKITNNLTFCQMNNNSNQFPENETQDKASQSQAQPQTQRKSKYPRLILENIFSFAPNSDTLGGTAYLLIHPQGNILVDCPTWDEATFEFCQQQGGVKYLFLTNRDGISKKVRQIHQDLNCELIIQEQEGYLLPNLDPITFVKEHQIYDDCQLIWTCGYTPASSCLYLSQHQGLLFSGRHILPISPTEITALKLKKTFHWLRQLKSVQLLIDRFNEDNLTYILPGANTGYLRGQGYVDRAYNKLMTINQ